MAGLVVAAELGAVSAGSPFGSETAGPVSREGAICQRPQFLLTSRRRPISTVLWPSSQNDRSCLMRTSAQSKLLVTAFHLGRRPALGGSDCAVRGRPRVCSGKCWERRIERLFCLWARNYCLSSDCRIIFIMLSRSYSIMEVSFISRRKILFQYALCRYFRVARRGRS